MVGPAHWPMQSLLDCMQRQRTHHENDYHHLACAGHPHPRRLHRPHGPPGERRAIPAIRDIPARPVTPAIPEPPEPRATRETRVTQGLRAAWGPQGPQAGRAARVLPACKAPRATRGIQVPRVPRATPATLVARATPVIPEPRAMAVPSSSYPPSRDTARSAADGPRPAMRRTGGGQTTVPGHTMACATITFWPLNVAAGDPYNR